MKQDELDPNEEKPKVQFSDMDKEEDDDGQLLRPRRRRIIRPRKRISLNPDKQQENFSGDEENTPPLEGINKEKEIEGDYTSNYPYEKDSSRKVMFLL